MRRRGTALAVDEVERNTANLRKAGNLAALTPHQSAIAASFSIYGEALKVSAIQSLLLEEKGDRVSGG